VSLTRSVATAHDGSWSSPPASPVLADDAIHVWRAELEPPPWRHAQLAATLSSDERGRAERFRLEDDRRRFVVARGLLRAILGRYLDVDPGRLEFAYGPRGKPALAEPLSGHGLSFSVAHSRGLALYALARHSALGVDLECVRADIDAEAVAARSFSAREQSALRSLSAAARLHAFFNGWTRKEAYLKAVGEGLSERLNSVEVSLAPGAPPEFLGIAGNAEEAAWWSLVELTPAPGYVGALAAEGRGWTLSCFGDPQDGR